MNCHSITVIGCILRMSRDERHLSINLINHRNFKILGIVFTFGFAAIDGCSDFHRTD
jgi:hypothetical protein